MQSSEKELEETRSSARHPCWVLCGCCSKIHLICGDKTMDQQLDNSTRMIQRQDEGLLVMPMNSNKDPLRLLIYTACYNILDG